jgi:hypothetical protein
VGTLPRQTLKSEAPSPTRTEDQGTGATPNAGVVGFPMRLKVFPRSGAFPSGPEGNRTLTSLDAKEAGYAL